jgi:hypothetical protein
MHFLIILERNIIGLEEIIVKEIEQNQLTWYGHVQRMVEGRLPKIALRGESELLFIASHLFC